MNKTVSAVALASVLLAGCATTPMGPTVPVLPPAGKSLADFDRDEDVCTRYADDRVAGRVQEANDDQLRRGIIGTAIGAGLGALVGDTKGAIIGGTAGAIIGGTSSADRDRAGLQRRYNIAYAQCMTARGNTVDDRGPPRRRYRD